MNLYGNKIFNDFLNIIIKTGITTLVIGYIVFNITYIRNDCPINENIFNICEQIDLDESWEGRSLYNQHVIFPEYMKWIYNALFFDFGVFSESDNTDVFNYALKALSISFVLILVSLFFGLLASISFILLNKLSFIKDYIIEPFLSLSFIHLVIYVIYFQSFLTDGSILSTILLCLITALGSGILFDFYTLLNNEHKYIVSKDYVVFARNSGFNEYNFAYKELLISIIYISTSRIPIIFGGMIIIEVLSNGTYQGIGFSIWKNIYKEINYSAFFGSTFLSVSVFTLIYYLTEHIKVEVLDR